MIFNVKIAGTVIGTAIDCDSGGENNVYCYKGFIPRKGIFPSYLEGTSWTIAIYFEDGLIEFYDDEAELFYKNNFKFSLA